MLLSHQPNKPATCIQEWRQHSAAVCLHSPKRRVANDVDEPALLTSSPQRNIICGSVTVTGRVKQVACRPAWSKSATIGRC